VLSTNRDHSHSILIRDSASLDASAHDGERSGWGGRLAQHAGKNIASLTQNVRLFCNGEKVGEPLKHSNERVIDMSDSRKVSLQEFNLATASNNDDPWRMHWEDARIKRALKSYYATKGGEMGSQSPYYPIIQNEIILRQFGQGIDNRLAEYPIPDQLAALYDWDNQSGNLTRRSFGQQLRNLYDAVLCRDIIDLSVASIDYGGWDSHKKTPSMIEGQFNDLFGSGRGFDLFFQELEKVDPIAASRLIILISGEFGRQLAANGTQGTDHGAGNSMILIGKPVTGGCYGDMFPDSELGGGNADPRHTFAEPNSDILGLTSMEQVYARICDWVSTGTSDRILPGWRSSMLESDVNLANLLSTN